MGAAEALGGSGKDRFRRADRIVANVAVPHAQHGPAFTTQEVITSPVAPRPGVLTTVDLDHQPCLPAGEIGDIWSDRELTRELGTKARKQPPHCPFLWRRIRAQGSGALREIRVNPASHV